MISKELRLRAANPALQQQASVYHPQIQRILAAREIASLAELEYRLESLLPPKAIRNIDQAVDLLRIALDKDKQLLIFGDYDVDGATSTALCMRALTMMGFVRVSYLMPDRIIDGYGLSESISRRIVELKPDLVITVDNGISSHSGIEQLVNAGIEVIVTDHHLPADHLPDASVILNQNAWADETQGRNLAGVGVVFYLMLALRQHLREAGYFDDLAQQPNLATCLDLVAIGTVADLVPLDLNNRILVNEGLKRIRAGSCCAGVSALLAVSGKQHTDFDSGDIAFGLAPRINAAGRLDDITIGVRCLLAQAGEAMQLAEQLDQINSARKQIQQQMDLEAAQMMQALSEEGIATGFAIVLYRPEWHEGIIGIIAARLKEKFHRPCIVFTRADDGSLKGSGRSIAGVHLRDMLDQLDKQFPQVMIKFGGHAMAAGLTIEPDQLPCFERELNRILQNDALPGCFDPTITHDGELDNDCLSLDFAQQLLYLTPWGQRFPLPSFIGEFNVNEQRVLSGKHLKFDLSALNNAGENVDAIAFFQPEAIIKQQFDVIKIHYELSINRFRNNESLQLMIKDILY